MGALTSEARIVLLAVARRSLAVHECGSLAVHECGSCGLGRFYGDDGTPSNPFSRRLSQVTSQAWLDSHGLEWARQAVSHGMKSSVRRQKVEALLSLTHLLLLKGGASALSAALRNIIRS
jgi:hypothetical protein